MQKTHNTIKNGSKYYAKIAYLIFNKINIFWKFQAIDILKNVDLDF